MNANLDPRTKYPVPPFKEQEDQSQPGETKKMDPQPDHGEETYAGHGRLRGLKTLITGADSGIGRAVAIAYAREGADVAFTYLPEEAEEAKVTCKHVEDAGSNCLIMATDLTVEKNCVETIEKTVTEFGALDVLVLNAGIQHERDKNANFSRESMLEVFDTNLVAPILLMREAAPHLKPGASVIITASIQSFHPSPDLLDYGVTKAGLAGLTTALAEEQGERGVRVNAVAPGATWTPLIPATGWDEKVEHFGENSPLGRPAQPAELAGAYVYLASEDASYTSGSIIKVTGGRT